MSQSGYRESSIIAAKEIFRNYPSINNKFDERIYFADLLFELELFEEAIEDYVKISEMDLSKEENKSLNRKMEKASLKLAGNN